jgi:hypothetical protein
MTHFSGGHCQQRASWLPAFLLEAMSAFFLGTDPGEKGISQHNERDVPIPCRPATNFILIEAHVFCLFKILFSTPTLSNGFHHHGKRRPLWSEDQVILLVGRIGQTAANEQPMALIVRRLGAGSANRPSRSSAALWFLPPSRAAASRVRKASGSRPQRPSCAGAHSGSALQSPHRRPPQAHSGSHVLLTNGADPHCCLRSVSATTQRMGMCACQIRSSMSRASSHLVWNRAVPGIPA